MYGFLSPTVNSQVINNIIIVVINIYVDRIMHCI